MSDCLDRCEQDIESQASNPSLLTVDPENKSMS